MRYDAKALFKKLVDVAGPPQGWKGNCYGTACIMVNYHVVKGDAVYGHWKGPVTKGSMFAGKGIVRHGWVLLPDGRVCDPTRWVFEGKRPYVYVGPADHYDEGGNRLREALLGPPPEFDLDEQSYRITQRVLNSEAWAFVERQLGIETEIDRDEPGAGLLTRSQLNWLAHISPTRLGEHGKAIYAALEKLGMRALVPIDNWMAVERGRLTAPTK